MLVMNVMDEAIASKDDGSALCCPITLVYKP
jgi:hypothetical protein